MDPSTLATRLRTIVRGGPVRPNADLAGGAGVMPAAATSGAGTPTDAGQVLGGGWRSRDGLSCFVVERRRDPDTFYGGERLATIGARLQHAAAEAPVLMGGAPGRPPFVFFDLETTGLSGGAGTCAFLVGCGGFDEAGGFETRQYLLLRQADERELLQMVGAELATAGALVSFNGKSFDAPLIETRFLFHRLDGMGVRLPHLDVLHPARRFWGEIGTGDQGCSLATLESLVLGARRAGDVPGAEIPGRYFQFVRTGDARPLVAVLEHNRLDLLSLAGLTARLLELVRTGPGAARHAHEARALGRLYARCGLDGRAREAYEHALAAGPVSVKVDALRSLALLSRRARRYDEAAAFWRRLLGLGACPPLVAREANEALAVHHEHRARDLAAARAFALRSLAGLSGTIDARQTARSRAARHRLARIERKMSGGGPQGAHPTERRPLFPS